LKEAGMLEGRGRQLLPLKSGWSDNFEYAIWKRMTETELQIKSIKLVQMWFYFAIVINMQIIPLPLF
jgi:hypothetical protein